MDDMEGMDGSEPMDGEDYVEYDVATEMVKGLQQLIQLQAHQIELLGALLAAVSAPKQLVRDEAQRVIGLAPVQRG